jgi:hypothetical protein
MNNRTLVIKDLDDTHLLVHPDWVNFIKEETAKILEKNLFTDEDAAAQAAKR